MIRRLLLILLGPVALLPCTAGAPAQDGVTDPAVRAWMQNERAASRALDTLGAMAGQSRIFDADRAVAARRTLIDAMVDAPRLFRRPRADPLSRVRPEAWADRGDFRARARVARRAARDLDIRSPARLRRTLPPLVAACLDCHHAYRDP